ncbi:MAG: hypothetical protein HY645_14800 [Acidobacteria bacterium]|nr:hypothetical protein [Acidobacteriota bacterium]
MQTLSLLWGILALFGMLIGFVPLLGALNWLNIPFSVFGIIFSCVVLATTRKPNKGAAVAGLVACCIAVFFGLIRLALGGGIL